MINKFSKYKNSGFTFIELIIALMIITTLLGVVMMNLLNVYRRSTIDSLLNTIMADIKSQQIKAMSSETEGRSSPSSYGLHFDQNKYVLFHGDIYNPNENTNANINLDETFTFDGIGLPNGNVVFSLNSGEILNFTLGSDWIRVKDTTNNQTKTLVFNKLGQIIQVN